MKSIVGLGLETKVIHVERSFIRVRVIFLTMKYSVFWPVSDILDGFP